MKFKPLFCNVTEDQMKVFNSISPVIERTFPKAFCFTDCWKDQITFELKYDVKEKDKVVENFPNQNLVNSLYYYLLYLKTKNASKINFQILCDETGLAWGIKAIW